MVEFCFNRSQLVAKYLQSVTPALTAVIFTCVISGQLIHPETELIVRLNSLLKILCTTFNSTSELSFIRLLSILEIL